jgi:transcriptional regulator with XRE-family HTH domain
MHPYRELIQSEMDARGWRPSELARRAGLHRQLISKILNDQRDHLGQMPDDATLAGIAAALGIPEGRVRQAAARSLDGYIDASSDPLDSYSTEYLLDVIKRRVGTDLPMAARNETEPKPPR